MIIKNIESKIKLATFLSFGSFLTSIVICGLVSAYAYQQVSNARQSIYILDHDTPILAKQTTMEMNRPAEYRAAVDLYHSLFFNLTPDDKHIEYQMRKAMYYIDESGVGQYNNLKEKGYFNAILSSSSVLSIQTDSIVLDQNRFRFYGKQKIDRRSATITRSLLTEGELIDIPRSENNSHGVLITNWKTVENKDLSNVSKHTF